MNFTDFLPPNVSLAVTKFHWQYILWFTTTVIQPPKRSPKGYEVIHVKRFCVVSDIIWPVPLLRIYIVLVYMSLSPQQLVKCTKSPGGCQL